MATGFRYCGRLYADMTYNPSKLPEGQAIKCSASEATVYRLTGGKRCGYPSEAVATSWDANWKNFLVVDCATLPVGDVLQYNPSKLAEGQAIKCAASAPEVYRLVVNSYRWYPSPEIASSWDANWQKFLVVDCSVLTQGEKLYRHPRGLADGSTIKCEDQSEMYRLVGLSRRKYADVVIAKSWDADCDSSAVAVDCSTLTEGDDMPFNQPPLTEGQAVRCIYQDADKVFRLCADLIRLYPSPNIAASWDLDWANAVLADCSKFLVGPNMTPRSSPEASAY